MNKIEIKNKLNKIVESKIFKITIYSLGIICILFFVFELGMMAGFRKASFSRNWGDNYERNFGPNHNKPPFFDDNFSRLPNPNGAIGKIIKIEYPNIVVLDKDQTEKVIIVNDATNILERKEKVTKDSLVVDKYIVVIGSPNDKGQIEAKLIRIIPSPEEMINNDMKGVEGDILPDFNKNNR